MPDVLLEKVRKEFGGGVVAVRDVTLRIPEGEFMCLLGPSGSGKSTLLRMIAGLEALTAGEIRIGPRVVDSVARGQYVPPERRGVGLVFQSYALWPHMTVEENVEFGLAVRRTPERERKMRVAEVLALLDITGLAGRYPWQISGGQQQRVALARALVVEPEVLLLDEPLSNLDARLRVELRAELKRLHRQLGTTVLYVTHDQLEAMTLGTMVGVMREGVVEEVGEPMAVYREPVNRFVAEFLGSPPINIVEVRGDNVSNLGAALLAFMERTLGAGRAAEVWTVGIRPEALRLGGDATEGAWVAGGSVETVMPTGAMWIVGVRVLGEVLYASCLEEPRAGPCHCWTPREDIIAFAGDGRRIPWVEKVPAGG